MNLRQYLRATLRHYWRTNAAIVAGIAAATAVIGGALLVGASMRSSLEQMTLERLARVDHVLTGWRFFREELADELKPADGAADAFTVAPGVILPGSLTAEKKPESAGATEKHRTGGVMVYGIDDRFWQMTDPGDLAAPGPDEVVLNRRTADELGAVIGDEVSLVVEIPPSIPRDSLLGERNETVAALTLTVSGIAEDRTTQGRFGLNPSQQLPRNAFVKLQTLQDPLGLAATRATRRGGAGQPARINTLFVSMHAPADRRTDAISPAAAEQLSQRLATVWTLEDLALRIVQNEEHGYDSLESRQLILDNTLSDAAQQAASELKLNTSPVLVYLINEIANPQDEKAYSMYAVAAGIEFTGTPPFGPFEWAEPPEGPIGPDELVINDWLAQDLKVSRGDTVHLKYHQVGDRGDLPELETDRRVAGIVKLAGVADDRGYTPDVPGITDVQSLGDWRQPFPLKLERVTPRDDAYWDPQDQTRKAYRATPKIFLPLTEAQKLWKSRYGGVTSFRFAPGDGRSLDDAARAFETRLLTTLTPEKAGLAFLPAKSQGLLAAAGTTDFAGLFFGFSFFLILAAAILIGLLFRLNIEQRLPELGLLSAVGFSSKRSRRLMLGEGAMLVAIGGVLGALLAIAFAAIVIYGLTTWWVGAVGTTFLTLSIDPVSLVTGVIIAAVVAAVAIWWALRRTNGASARSLLAGTLEATITAATRQTQRRRARRTSLIAGATAVLLAIASLAGLVPQQEAFAGLPWPAVVFFLVGIAALVASVSLLGDRLTADRSLAIHGRGAVWRLALRNAGRQRGRSLLTVGLIAAATFIIVAIAAGHRNPGVEQPQRDSGNGGYTLVAETSVPLLYDLNTPEGRAKLSVDPPRDAPEIASAMHVASLRIKPGEDASCLNLYRTQLPTILGVPDDLIRLWQSEGRFRFVGTGGAHPWDVLQSAEDSTVIPVIGDMNTLQYSLHISLGDMLDVPQKPEQLQIAGVLDSSVFQGVLLMSDANFHRLFPDQAGFGYFLVETPVADAARVSGWLETELSDQGFDSDRVADRLAAFLAVQNTYLSTFQALGGLGLLLGTFGLGAVMLRNVLERRAELALLKAVGFRGLRIALLVMCENGLLMLWGLAAGTAAALLAMTPHLASTGADVPWSGLVLLLAAVAAAGMATSLWAVRAAVSAPIVATLRGE